MHNPAWQKIFKGSRRDKYHAEGMKHTSGYYNKKHLGEPVQLSLYCACGRPLMNVEFLKSQQKKLSAL